MSIRNFNLRMSQVTKIVRFVLNQFLIYIIHFPHSHPIFYLTLFKLICHEPLFFGGKKILWCPSAPLASPQVTPMRLITIVIKESQVPQRTLHMGEFH